MDTTLDLIRSTPFLVVGALAAFSMAVGALRLARARQKRKRRVIEMPNSHYTSPQAKFVEARHRWHNIQLDQVHEVNRDEVVRLLAKVDALSADALRPRERAFLDSMTDLTANPA
jgi:hypothetical protein